MNMTQQFSLMLPANIDGNTFIRFALFDTFRLKGRWKAPVLFASIMTAFSIICFAVKNTHEQAQLLGIVLLAAGLVLPSVWFLMYMYSVRIQIKRNALSPRKTQYYVQLMEDTIKVMKDSDEIEYSWNEVYKAFRVKGCTYLYMSENRAYLLPKCDESDEAWEIITGSLSGEKVKDLR